MLTVVDDADLAEIYQDPDFLVDEHVPEVVDGHILAWTLTREKQGAMEEAQANHWPVTAINRPVDLLDDRHFAERGFFVPVEHPVAGTVRQPGAPIRLDDGWSIRRPAPLLGQHQAEVADELASGGAAGARATERSRPGSGAQTASACPWKGSGCST